MNDQRMKRREDQWLFPVLISRLVIHFIRELTFERKENKILMAGAGYLWLGGGERGLMHLVPAPAVKLMKSRVLSRPGVKKVEVRWCWVLTDGRVITS